MIERSRTPVSASCSVRGIGVALSVSTCTCARNCFSRSLWLTPKCCSSSTISKPRSLNLIDLPSSAWVPTTMSTLPSVNPFLTCVSSLAGIRREACATLTGKPLKRSAKFLLCCLPAAAAQPVQFDIGVIGAVARQQFDVLDRQEQLCFGSIMQFETVMRRAADLDGLQSDKASDAVLHVNHEIAGCEARDLRD